MNFENFEFLEMVRDCVGGGETVRDDICREMEENGREEG
jgi:hypothetical protein